ncbi:MAG TPA: SdrD B-like domain-containing protein [Propionibacteriaceae bacterium]|nr:SdrD B-like domain-containing protein [Propionibacteriaceae bacterium]
MLHTRHFQRSAAILAGLITLVGITLVDIVVMPVLAVAEPTDGTLTVIVNRDVDGNGNYSGDIDQPQPGIEIAVTDASEHRVNGFTDQDGRFVLRATSKLKGGRYFVVAKIPPALTELTPVPESSTFQPLSTTVDVTSDNQTVRMGVALGRPLSQPTPPQATGASRGSDRPGLAEFAVGDLVWRDDNRSGVQDPGESPAAQISVQLLDVAGEVVASTVSEPSGRYIFDHVSSGTYSVRFAGVPEEFRMTPTAAGDQRMIDSDPDYSGVTPPFTLGVGEANVRPTTTADGVTAAYINPTIDAGITALRYAIGNRVWMDLNSDGTQQPEEPAGSATVTLLTDTGNVVATTTTDATGRYQFSNLRGGRYRLDFTGLPAHRKFTERAAGANPTLDSDPDPATGKTSVFTLGHGAPNLVPVSDGDAGSTDFENQTVGAGLVGAYSVGDTVWRDDNGDGLLDAGDSGMAGVTVELLDEDSSVIATTVTSTAGRYSFDGLPAGTYKIKFSKLPDGLVFTCRAAGGNNAVDSDAYPSGVTALFTLGNDNPADTSVDAGLTTRDNYHPVPGRTKVPLEAALPTTGGIAPHIPVVGAALVVAGASCLLAARRRRSH